MRSPLVVFALLLLQWTWTTAFLSPPRQIGRFHPTCLNSQNTQHTDPSIHNISNINKHKKIAEFVAHVQESINENKFESLTLRGAKKRSSDDAESLRGSLRQVHGRLVELSKKDERILQLTLKYHGATDINKNWKLKDIPINLRELISDPSIAASEWGAQATKQIQGAELSTVDSTWDLQQLSSGKPKLIRRQNRAASSTQTDPFSHDRVKQVPLSNQADFLQALGVTKSDGKPRPGMTSKLRQCQKFVEIVGGLVQKLPKANDSKIAVVDMGCGRGYLTFALHSYLQEHYEHVESRGIDVRPKLVEEISGIAQSLGIKTLTFEEGNIKDVVEAARVGAAASEGDNSLDILIALHACDTATDDALWSGICRGADLLVVAPCCHKQIRSQLNAHFSANSQTHPLADILKHKIYRERLAETVTDSLRALLMEWAGYKVQVFEFIGGEHTSKNVMITAVKSSHSAQDQQEKIQERIQALASFHGIREHMLAKWMGIDLVEGGSDHRKLSARAGRMPPLSPH
jgi:hypothetical protein